MKKLSKKLGIGQTQTSKSPELKVNPFVRFLLFSSGVNMDILLKHCPEEINKYASIGWVILMTAVMAVFSGGYAFYITFDNVILSIFFGILWGIVIFSLDRYIVMSIKKPRTEKLSTIWIEQDKTKKKKMILEKIGAIVSTFFMALPRFILAILIAFVVSKPLELRLFQDRINKELKYISTQDISEFEQKFKREVDEIQRKITGLEQQKQQEIKNIFKDNPVYQKRLKRKQQLEREIEQIQKQIEENIKIIDKNRYLKTGYRKVTKYHIDGTPYTEIQEYKYWAYNRIAKGKIQENKNLKSYLHQKRQELQQIEAEIKSIENEARDKIKEIEEKYDKRIAVLMEQLQQKQASYPTELAEWKSKVRKSDDILARLEALSRITDKNPTTKAASWLITLLLITLETAPVFVKLLTKRGPYDEILDRIEHEYFVEQQKIISQINAKANSAIETLRQISQIESQTFSKVEHERIRKEKDLRKKVLEEILQKQEELVSGRTQKTGKFAKLY